MCQTSATPALEEAEEGAARGPSVLEREVSPAAQPLAAFCWHPAHEARLLALCHSGTADPSCSMCDVSARYGDVRRVA